MKTALNTNITLFNPQNAGNFGSENLFFNFCERKHVPRLTPLITGDLTSPSLLPLSNSQANHVFIGLINY